MPFYLFKVRLHDNIQSFNIKTITFNNAKIQDVMQTRKEKKNKSTRLLKLFLILGRKNDAAKCFESSLLRNWLAAFCQYSGSD